jgi:hypothetical protein
MLGKHMDIAVTILGHLIHNHLLGVKAFTWLGCAQHH